MAVVSVGNTALFESQVYDIPPQSTIDYMQNQAQSFMSSLMPTAANMFYNAVNTLYQEVDYTQMKQMARAYIRHVGNMFMRDEIQVLSNIGKLQHAPLAMQRWVMAEPTVRQLWIDQKVDGYSDTMKLVDAVTGFDHLDYRRVIDGLFLDDPDSDGLIAHNFYETEIAENDVALDVIDKSNILDTWERLRYELSRKKEDPTSKYNAAL